MTDPAVAPRTTRLDVVAPLRDEAAKDRPGRRLPPILMDVVAPLRGRHPLPTTLAVVAPALRRRPFPR